jgi:hypothetical protein
LVGVATIALPAAMAMTPFGVEPVTTGACHFGDE